MAQIPGRRPGEDLRGLGLAGVGAALLAPGLVPGRAGGRKPLVFWRATWGDLMWDPRFINPCLVMGGVSICGFSGESSLLEGNTPTFINWG